MANGNYISPQFSSQEKAGGNLAAKNVPGPAVVKEAVAKDVDQLKIGEHKRLLLQDQPPGHYCWVVPEHAQLSIVFGVFTPAELTIDVKLIGPYAKFSLYGLVATVDGQTTITINQHHQAPDTQSVALIKGLFANTAQGMLQGLVTIDALAQNSHASQHHKALLLGGQARCKAIPSFAVHHHQVRCNHGAAVGKLAIEQLMYLQSRGIPEAVARQLLSQGFAQEIIEQLRVDEQPRWQEKVAEVVQSECEIISRRKAN